MLESDQIDVCGFVTMGPRSNVVQMNVSLFCSLLIVDRSSMVNGDVQDRDMHLSMLEHVSHWPQIAGTHRHPLRLRRQANRFRGAMKWTP
jgi:hypothetical protein